MKGSITVEMKLSSYLLVKRCKTSAMGTRMRVLHLVFWMVTTSGDVAKKDTFAAVIRFRQSAVPGEQLAISQFLLNCRKCEKNDINLIIHNS